MIVNSVAACTGGRFFVFLKCLWRGFRWKFSTTSRFILKQLDYSLSISMRDSWLGLHPRQLSRDRNLELIIYLFNRNTRESFGELEKTSFRVLPNFHLCFYWTIRLWARNFFVIHKILQQKPTRYSVVSSLVSTCVLIQRSPQWPDLSHTTLRVPSGLWT